MVIIRSDEQIVNCVRQLGDFVSFQNNFFVPRNAKGQRIRVFPQFSRQFFNELCEVWSITFWALATIALPAFWEVPIEVYTLETVLVQILNQTVNETLSS